MNESFKYINEKQGFTLIEIICSLVLMGIVSSMIGMGINQAITTYIMVTDSVEGIQKGQIVMAKLTKEFLYLSEIKLADDSSMVFTGDGKEKEIYFKADEDCIFFDDDTTTSDPAKLTDGVTSFSLTYYEFYNGAAIFDPEVVNIIEISMKFKGIESFEFKDRIFLRDKN